MIHIVAFTVCYLIVFSNKRVLTCAYVLFIMQMSTIHIYAIKRRLLHVMLRKNVLHIVNRVLHSGMFKMVESNQHFNLAQDMALWMLNNSFMGKW